MNLYIPEHQMYSGSSTKWFAYSTLFDPLPLLVHVTARNTSKLSACHGLSWGQAPGVMSCSLWILILSCACFVGLSRKLGHESLQSCWSAPRPLSQSLSRAYQYDTVHSCSIMFPRPLAIPPCYQLDWILNAWTLAFASKAYSSSTARAACVSLPKSGRSASHKFNSSAFLVLLNVTCVFIPPRAVLSYFDAITMPFYSSHCV